MATFSMYMSSLEGEQRKEIKFIYLHGLYTYAKLRYFNLIYLKRPCRLQISWIHMAA